MSYTRTAIATTIIAISIAAVGTGTHPANASGRLAGSPTPTERAISHESTLQASEAEVVEARTFTTNVIAETTGQADAAYGALDQLAAAGFELPPVTIYMHSDRADCSGDPNRVLNGYFVQIDGENIVHSCGNEWTLLHELTHVWDKNVLDDETRGRIMEHQGLDSWMSDTWDQAGGEHLASIVAWAIEGTHPSRIGHYDRNHLAEAYEMVTGEDPPAFTRNASPIAEETTAGPVAIPAIADSVASETRPPQ